MIFFSSIIGAKISNISLNKICIIPLYIYLLFHINKKPKISTDVIPLLLFYLTSVISAILSLTAPYSSIQGYTSRSVMYLVQTLFIYIPLAILIYNYHAKQEILESSKSAAVFTYRINILFALLEFFSFFLVNTTLSNGILKLFYGIDNASALINLGSLGIFLRPTGLNMDPAYFGIILTIGIIFEKKKIWKWIGMFVAIISMSRTAIIIVIVLYIYEIIRKKNILMVSKEAVISISAVLFAITLLLLKSSNISSQIAGLLARFNIFSESQSADYGTLRHLVYIPKSIEVFITQFNPIQMLFGFGPRQSGTIIANSHIMDNYLNAEMFKMPWTIECDISELLLGYGIVGLILYYVNVFSLKNYGDDGRKLLIVIFLYSIMYDISSSTIAVLFIMIYKCCNVHSEVIDCRV